MHAQGCLETASARHGRCPFVYIAQRRCEFYATTIQGFCAPSMNMENPMQVPVTILNLDGFKSRVSIWTSVRDAAHVSALYAIASRPSSG